MNKILLLFFFYFKGTGASCIYPLLGVKQCNWIFYCTETNISSIEIAKNNIKQNNLDEFIYIYQTKKNSIFNVFKLIYYLILFCFFVFLGII